MDARFRIRTREGKELEPRTLEIFSELVRSGVIRPDDLVFDALTGEWAPARVHPMVRLFQDPLAVDPMARSLDARIAAAEPPGGGAPGGGGSGGLELDLVAPPQVSPQEEARAFIEKMEAERRDDPEQPALARDLPLTSDGPTVVEGLVASPAPPRVQPLHVPFPAVVEEYGPSRRRRPGGHPGWRRWAVGLGLAGVGTAAMVLGLGVGGDGRRAQELEGLAQAETARPVRAVSASEEDVRGAAYSGFLREVDGVRGRLALGEVPSVWLEGRYLAGARGYPEVRRYWEQARAYTEEVRRREVELYRAAFLSAAEGLGLSGPVRSLRLATAVEDFTAAAPAREEHYTRMGELAAAALDLHAVLVELEGRVTYEPIRGQRVSADPVLEAAGTDEEAQALLEMALDRVLRALHGPDGTEPGERSQVSGWLVRGLEGVGR